MVGIVASWLKALFVRSPTALDLNAFARTTFCDTVTAYETRQYTPSSYWDLLLGVYAMFYKQFFPDQENINPTLEVYWNFDLIERKEAAASAGVDLKTRKQSIDKNGRIILKKRPSLPGAGAFFREVTV